MHVKNYVAKAKKVAAKMLEAKCRTKLILKMESLLYTKSNKKKTIGEVAFACYLPGVNEMKLNHRNT